MKGCRLLFNRLTLPVLFVLVSPSAAISASPQPHWVGTWAASPLHPDRADLQEKPGAPPRPRPQRADITIREIVHVSLGGQQLRVRFSNLDGSSPLILGAAEIARTLHEAAIVPGTSSRLTFNGKASVSIPPGALIVSDPISFNLAPISDLTVSMYISAASDYVTEHQLASATSYHATGNSVSQENFDAPQTRTTWEYLNGIDVLAPGDAAAIATIGDSITDGAYSTANTNQRWPDELARRLQANRKYSNLAVLNESISGNKMLMDRAGPSALARFDRDILAQSGVKYLVILEGINDIGNIQKDPSDPTSAIELIAGLNQMIVRAHAHGIVVIGGTLTPFSGLKSYFSEKTEAIRLAVNQWIRTGGAFDAVIDFDAATRDPAHPDTFLPAYDHGDHLHPNDTGYKAMGASIDLKLFTLKPHKP